MSRNNRAQMNNSRFPTSKPSSYQQTYGTTNLSNYNIPHTKPPNTVKQVDPWDWSLDSSNTPSSQSSHSAHHSIQDPWDWPADDNQNLQAHSTNKTENKSFTMENPTKSYSDRYELPSSYQGHTSNKEQAYDASQHNPATYPNWQQMTSAPTSGANFYTPNQNFGSSVSEGTYQNKSIWQNEPLRTEETQIQYSHSVKSVPNQQQPSWNIEQDNMYWKTQANESSSHWQSSQNAPQIQEMPPLYKQPETQFTNWNTPSYSPPEVSSQKWNDGQQNWNVGSHVSGNFQPISNVQPSNNFPLAQPNQTNNELKDKREHVPSPNTWTNMANYNERMQTDQVTQNKTERQVYSSTMESLNNPPSLYTMSQNNMLSHTKNDYQENCSNTQMFAPAQFENKENFQHSLQHCETNFEVQQDRNTSFQSEPFMVSASNDKLHKENEKDKHLQTDHHHYDSAQVTNPAIKSESKQIFSPGDYSYCSQSHGAQNKPHESENRQNFEDGTGIYPQVLNASKPQENRSFHSQSSLPQSTFINNQRQAEHQLAPSKMEETANKAYPPREEPCKYEHFMTSDHSPIRSELHNLEDPNVNISNFNYFRQEGSDSKQPSPVENYFYASNLDHNTQAPTRHENLENIKAFEKNLPHDINEKFSNVSNLGIQGPQVVSHNNYNIDIGHDEKEALQISKANSQAQPGLNNSPENIGEISQINNKEQKYNELPLNINAGPNFITEKNSNSNQPTLHASHSEQANLDDAPNQEVVLEKPSLIIASKNNSEVEPLAHNKMQHTYPTHDHEVNQEMIPENLEKPPDIESFSKSRNLRSHIQLPVAADSQNVSLLDPFIDLPPVTLVPSTTFEKQHISNDKIKSPYIYDKKVPSEKDEANSALKHETFKKGLVEKQMAAHLLESLQKLDISELPSTRSSSRQTANKENEEKDKISSLLHHATESIQNKEHQEIISEIKELNSHGPVQSNNKLAHELQNTSLITNNNNTFSSNHTFTENENTYTRQPVNIQKSDQDPLDQQSYSSPEKNTLFSSETQYQPHLQQPLEQNNGGGTTSFKSQEHETNFRDPHKVGNIKSHQSHPDVKTSHDNDPQISQRESLDNNIRDDQGNGPEGRRHSYEEPSSHFKEKDYRSTRRDSLDSHISSRMDSRLLDHEINLRQYEDGLRDEQRRISEGRIDGDTHKRLAREDFEVDHQYRHHRQDPKLRSPYSEASNHSYSQPRRHLDYRYNETIPPYRERQKIQNYDDEYFSDTSRPSSRTSIERFHKENTSHYRSMTPSMTTESDRAHDFYESRSNYEEQYRRYGPGYYPPHPYPPGYGYPYYSYDGHPYYPYYREYRNAYYNYYQRPNPEPAYPAPYYDTFHRGSAEYSNQESSSMPPSFSEEFPKDDVNKYSQDMEQNSFIESETSIPSIHSESHYQMHDLEKPVQVDEPPLYSELKYKTAHCIVRFTPFGQLLMVVPGNIATHVEIHDLQQILSNDDTFQQLKSFPGPLIKSRTYKNNVLQICQKRLGLCEEERSKISDYESFVLLWKLMIILLRQNGTIEGSDISGLLLEDHVPSRYASRQQLSSQASHENLLKADNELSICRDLISQDEIANKFRELLLYGNKHEALEYAMKNSLWGHALFLASKMDSKHHSKVLTRFANSLAQNDPLQTLYQLMSNRQPAAVTCIAEESWGDWRPHLAMILSNPTHSLVDRSSIVTLAESLYSRDHLYATHFCYLIVQEFGSPTNKKNGKVILIGSSNNLPFKEFARPEAIQWTEIYEYALSLGGSYYLPHLIPYKLYYTSLLIDYGFIKEAFEYLEMLSEIAESYHLRYLIFDLANRIRCFDPQMEAEELEWIDNLWRSIYGSTDFQSNSEVSSTLHLDECGSVEPLVPPIHPEGPPLTSTSEQPASFITTAEKPQDANEWSKPLESEVRYLPDAIRQTSDLPQKLESSLTTNSATIISEPQAHPPPVSNSSASIQPFSQPRKQSFNATLPSRQHALLSRQPSKPVFNLDKKKQDKKKPSTDKSQSSRWLGGIFSMFLPKQPTQMILPDDKNPSIVYDNDKKRWVDLTSDEEETIAPEAPPADMDLNVQPPEISLPPSGLSRFSRPKSMPIGANYVNVNSNSVAPLSKAELPPELELVAQPPPQTTNFFNPADFSSKTIQSPQTSRNPYSKQ